MEDIIMVISDNKLAIHFFDVVNRRLLHAGYIHMNGSEFIGVQSENTLPKGSEPDIAFGITECPGNLFPRQKNVCFHRY